MSLPFYLLASTLICLVFLLMLPTNLPPMRNLTGSLILATAFGWLCWPIAILAWYVHRRENRPHGD